MLKIELIVCFVLNLILFANIQNYLIKQNITSYLIIALRWVKTQRNAIGRDYPTYYPSILKSRI